MEFETYPVRARKDLLHFVEEQLDKNVLEKLGKEPKRWIEELNIIHGMLTGDCLVAGQGVYAPPTDDSEFQKLGNDVYLYRGKQSQLHGLWTSKEIVCPRMDNTQWIRYVIGSRAVLCINKGYDSQNHEAFLPENFERNCKVLKKNKRPVLEFQIEKGNESVDVIAKGCDICISHAYEPPSFRLTNLSRVYRTSSEKEMEWLQELDKLGVKVPKIIGHYKALTEEFLFLEKVKGESPEKYLESHRAQLIEQDAQMLAALCMLGYRKCGFCDADDKIFDSKNLYLIDVDELRDLYFPNKFDFRKMLMNPAELSELNEFRALQKSVFRKMLKDALYNYRNSLTPSFEHMKMYIYNFYSKAGWPKPDNDEIRALTEFPDNYQTWDSYISMATEE